MPHAIPMGLTTSLTISLTFVHAFVHTEYFRVALTFAKPTIHSRVRIMPTPFASTPTRKGYARDEIRMIGVGGEPHSYSVSDGGELSFLSLPTPFRLSPVDYRDTIARNPHTHSRSFRLYPLGTQLVRQISFVED